ncbi:hypothetical protein EDD85DRAFT_1027352 [Armillaria nabsnona]|nr:hypothetical protein EDD85DRAFT_1027352 [Armillaria nabsnona]
MSSPDIPSLGMTLGALYIGATVAAILFGITNLQAVIYYKNYPDDWWVYRYSVALLWILDALHVALSMHALYHYLIDLFGNFAAIYDVVWSFKLQNLFNVVIVMAVQALYAIRLWKLDQNSYKVVLWFVILAVMAAFGSGIYTIVDVYSLSNFLSMEKIRKAICFSFTITEVSDFIIAVAMCYYLHKSRSVTKFSSYKCMCIAITNYGMAFFSTIPDTNILPQFFVWPNSFIFVGIDFILPKLYINSLLALLNSWKGHKSEHSKSHLLRFPPNNCSADTGEQGVNILLTETRTSDHIKDSHNCEV